MSWDDIPLIPVCTAITAFFGYLGLRDTNRTRLMKAEIAREIDADRNRTQLEIAKLQTEKYRNTNASTAVPGRRKVSAAAERLVEDKVQKSDYLQKPPDV